MRDGGKRDNVRIYEMLDGLNGACPRKVVPFYFICRSAKKQGVFTEAKYI